MFGVRSDRRSYLSNKKFGRTIEHSVYHWTNCLKVLVEHSTILSNVQLRKKFEILPLNNP
jgi:hypothetical protein